MTTKPKNSRPKYEGVLAQKIPMPAAPTLREMWLQGSSQYEAQQKRRHDLLERQAVKLPALFSHFGIKTVSPLDRSDEAIGATWQLLLALAEAHVPGFQIQPSGRKRGAGTRDALKAVSDLDVFYAVQHMKHQYGINGVPRACAELVKNKMPFRGHSARGLHERYKHVAGKSFIVRLQKHLSPDAWREWTTRQYGYICSIYKNGSLIPEARAKERIIRVPSYDLPPGAQFEPEDRFVEGARPRGKSSHRKATRKV